MYPLLPSPTAIPRGTCEQQLWWRMSWRCLAGPIHHIQTSVGAASLALNVASETGAWLCSKAPFWLLSWCFYIWSAGVTDIICPGITSVAMLPSLDFFSSGQCGIGETPYPPNGPTAACIISNNLEIAFRACCWEANIWLSLIWNRLWELIQFGIRNLTSI